MLTVTLVATFAAAALWQQWRAVEVEAAERARVQSGWVLIGALDWSRLILREDARAGGADHLAEPWAVPLAEAKLTSFLAADKNIASDALEGLPEVFLSGRIVDAQSRLNVMNLVAGGKPVPDQVAAFTKLFELLSLPGGELAALTANLQRATAGIAPTSAGPGQTPAGSGQAGTGQQPAGTTQAPTPTPTPTGGSSSDSDAPLLPQRTAQLAWLGLSPKTVSALEPYVTILPLPTALNINTASAEALFASVPALDLATAKRLVAQRTRSHFRSLSEANAQLQQGRGQFAEGRHDVATRYFEVRGRLRLEQTWVEEHSLVRREDNLDVRTIWRERGAGTTAGPEKP
jgi:general secretion pathway protein K